MTYGIIPWTPDEYPLALDRVRYIGDGVAAVAAVDEDTAIAALDLIEVEYEELPAFLDPFAALEADGSTPYVHEPRRRAGTETSPRRSTWSSARWTTSWTPPTWWWRATTSSRARRTRPSSRTAPSASGSRTDGLRGPGARRADGRAGKLTVWSATQVPHYLHRELARVLDVDPARVRVIQPLVGGAFGGKSEPFDLEFCVAKLAMKTGRPVKILYTREEVFYAHRGRHPFHMTYRTGCDGREAHERGREDRPGRRGLRLLRAGDDVLLGPAPVRALRHAGVPLRLDPGVHEQAGVRAQARPRLGAAPLRLRGADRQAGRAGGAGPHRVPPRQLHRREHAHGERAAHHVERLPGVPGLGGAGQRLEGEVPAGCRSAGAWAWPAPRTSRGRTTPSTRTRCPSRPSRCRSTARAGWRCSAAPARSARGATRWWRTIAAEELGVPLEHVRVYRGDTDFTPVDLGAYSSRVTFMLGNAAIDAARKLRARCRRRWRSSGGEARRGAAGGRAARCGRRTPSGRCRCARPSTWPRRSSGRWAPPGGTTRPRTSTATTAAGPSARRRPTRSRPTWPRWRWTSETGFVDVKKIWVAHDCGRALNPVLVEGQMEGSAYMGFAEALMEEQVFKDAEHGRAGLHNAPSLLDYRIPTSLDTPELESLIVESIDPEGPYGAKEAGEGPLHPVHPRHRQRDLRRGGRAPRPAALLAAGRVARAAAPPGGGHAAQAGGARPRGAPPCERGLTLMPKKPILIGLLGLLVASAAYFIPLRRLRGGRARRRSGGGDGGGPAAASERPRPAPRGTTPTGRSSGQGALGPGSRGWTRCRWARRWRARPHLRGHALRAADPGGRGPRAPGHRLPGAGLRHLRGDRASPRRASSASPTRPALSAPGPAEARYDTLLTELRYRGGTSRAIRAACTTSPSGSPTARGKGLRAGRSPGSWAASRHRARRLHEHPRRRLPPARRHREPGRHPDRRGAPTAAGRWFIPQDRIAGVADRIHDGDIIAATSTVPGLDVAHTGLALWVGRDAPPHARAARGRLGADQRRAAGRRIRRIPGRTGSWWRAPWARRRASRRTERPSMLRLPPYRYHRPPTVDEAVGAPGRARRRRHAGGRAARTWCPT